jgi:unsaturated chondroitin disaccharide hydrolase
MKQSLLTFGLGVLLLSACQGNAVKTNQDLIDDNVKFATQQIGRQVEIIEESGRILNPRTIKCDKIQYVPIDDWTSGFFPGTMWYMYELTGDEKWKDLGVKYTEDLDSVKYLTWHHDVGFMINCSYGNAYRLTQNENYKEVLVEAAKSLATRYRPTPGVIQSWDEDRGWQGTRGWMCPVIIDNMMNLELFFEATRITGDSAFYHMAVSHADVTLKNHFRKDFSTYHVIDYDKIKGGVRHKHTAQGYAHESTWARGQAWAIYGFAVCYRETKDLRYLTLIDNIYKYLFTHKHMPEDLVPYWDFDAPHIPNEPRDASAATIIASALYEISTFGRPEYKNTADKIITSLSSPSYRAILGTNANFLLRHSVGSIPHGHEIDVPLNYADYYFLEALLRKQAIEK